MLNVTQLLCGPRPGEAPIPRPRHLTAEPCPRPMVAWAITQACNLSEAPGQPHSAPRPAEGELNFTEGLRLLNDLRAFEVPAVVFTGGEPLMREDALDLMEHAGEIGLNQTLSTNGTLIDDRIADRLAAVGISHVVVGIEGIEARHDRVRGRKGAFRQALEGLRRCKARGIRTAVRFTLHQDNYADLDAVFDLCHEQGIHRLAIYHLPYNGALEGRAIDLTHGQTREVVDRIFERVRADGEAGRELEVLTVGNHSDASYLLLKLEKIDPQRFHEARRLLAWIGGNRAGCDVAGIDPVGNVHYDPDSWHYTCGNVRQRSFGEIWTDPDDERLRILRDRYQYLPERCQICRFVGLCNGNSRTRAEAATGDWLSPDPACYIREEDLGLAVPTESIVPDLHTERRQRTADVL